MYDRKIKQLTVSYIHQNGHECFEVRNNLVIYHPEKGRKILCFYPQFPLHFKITLCHYELQLNTPAVEKTEFCFNLGD